jgi:chorismate mutase
LQPNRINLNARILAVYEQEIVPLICAGGDDEQYGSSAVCDVACLQPLSRRIHYGKFVAESKYRARPKVFDRLIRAGDRAGLLALITDEKVEKSVIARVGRKARTYSREMKVLSTTPPFDPAKAVEVYRRWIIPMNKEVQVEYLLSYSDVRP